MESQHYTELVLSLVRAFVAGSIAFSLGSCVSGASGSRDIRFDIAPGAPEIVLAGVQQTPAETKIRGEVALPMTNGEGIFSGSIEAPGQPPLSFRHIRVVPEPTPRKYGRRAFFAIRTGRRLPAGTRVRLAFEKV